ncbi:hypothetical protein D3C87_2070270 [compost metagenome]
MPVFCIADRAGAERESLFGHYFKGVEFLAEIGENGQRTILRFGGDNALVDTSQADPGRPAFVENGLEMSTVGLRDQQVKSVGT